jgi:hypothetical protein
MTAKVTAPAARNTIGSEIGARRSNLGSRYPMLICVKR